MLKKRKRNKMLDPNQPHLAASLKIRIPIKSLAMPSHYQNLQRIKKGNLRICWSIAKRIKAALESKNNPR